jgi:hypothetical protein
MTITTNKHGVISKTEIDVENANCVIFTRITNSKVKMILIEQEKPVTMKQATTIANLSDEWFLLVSESQMEP